jgi:hypothetical protein
MSVTFLGGLTRSRSFAANSGKLRAYPIKNGAHSAMYTGTPVKLSAGTLDVATNTAAVLGVTRSFAWIDKTTGQPQYSKYIPANTSTKNSGYLEGFTQPFALVDDNPNGTWIIKTDASVSSGEIGALARVTNAGAGSAVTGRGAAEADTTGTAVSAGNALFRIVGAYRISEITSAGAQDNNFDQDADTLLEVVLQNHLYN